MIACNVLKFTDPMVSLDIHQCIIPPSPTPFPLPYGHISFLGHGLLSQKAKYSGSAETLAKGPVTTLNIQPMLQGTCCGFFDVHLGNLANVLYPIMVVFSSSKSLFVSGSVQINGSPTAAAVLVIMNTNLNCNFPVSLPNGVVYAFSTVQVGLSIGDILAGVISGALQMIVDAVVGKFVSFASGLPISRSFNVSISQLSSRLLIRTVATNMHVYTPLATALGKYFGTSPVVAGLIAREAADGAIGGLQGIVMDNTPVEDTINNATTEYLGSGPNDTF
jgi:hypothetical protein